jgi:hypothetical protein
MLESPVNPIDRQERGLKLLQQMLGPEQAERTRQVWRDVCPDWTLAKKSSVEA